MLRINTYLLTFAITALIANTSFSQINDWISVGTVKSNDSLLLFSEQNVIPYYPITHGINFIDPANSILSIHDDSIQVSNSKITHYPYQITKDYVLELCENPRAPSWLGESINVFISPSNVTYKVDSIIFLNRQDEQILIRVDTINVQSWTTYENDSIRIEAKFSGYQKFEFENIVDTSLIITFQAFKNGILTDHQINQDSLLISKDFGIVKPFQFSHFPEETKSTYKDVVGIESIQKGITIPTWRQIYDIQIGDEFHKYRYSEPYFLDSTIHTDTLLYIEKITDRVDLGDTIILIKSIDAMHRIWLNGAFVSEQFNKDSIVVDSIFYAPIFDGVTEELAPYHDNSLFANNLTFNSTQSILRGLPYRYFSREPSYFVDDSCWHQFVVEGTCISPFYYPGFGRIDNNCADFYENIDTKTGLVYYKKGGEEKGNPLELNFISNTINTKFSNDINVFPNPANNSISISLKEDYWIGSLEIINLQGQIGKSQKMVGSQELIDISSIPAGLYVLKIKTSSGTLFSSKFVKE